MRGLRDNYVDSIYHGMIGTMVADIRRGIKDINRPENSVEERMRKVANYFGNNGTAIKGIFHIESCVEDSSIKLEFSVKMNMKTGKCSLYKYGTLWEGNNCIEDFDLT